MAGRKKKWTLEKLTEAAAQHGTILEFRESNPAAYSAAHREKVFDPITTHMRTLVKRVWNDDLVAKAALEYTSRGAFARGCPGAYTYANRQGLLDNICAHMPANMNTVNSKWTPEALAAEAARHGSKSAFRKGNRSA